MSSQPLTRSSALPPIEGVVERFQRLAATWQAKTAHYSSATRMAEHPAYQEIIALGEAAVPLLLREFARQSDHWFSALKAITGANPDARGRVDQMAAEWLHWGKANGYQW